MQPGASYVFSAYIKVLQHISQTSSDAARIVVLLNGKVIDSGHEYILNPSTAWNHIQYTFTAPTDASKAAKSTLAITIFGESTTATVQLGVDDVSIAPA